MFTTEFKLAFFSTLEKCMNAFPDYSLIDLATIWRADNLHDFANYCSFLIEANPGQGLGTLPICFLKMIPLKI